MSAPQYLEFSIFNCQTFSVELSAGASSLQFEIVNTGSPNKPPFVVEYTGASQGASLRALSVATNAIELVFAAPVDALVLRTWLQGDLAAGEQAWVTANVVGAGAMVACEIPGGAPQSMTSGVALQIT